MKKKTAEPQGIQLELNFNGTQGNRFKDHLDNGDFSVLVELHTPPGNTKAEHAAGIGSELEYIVSSRKKTASALAFSDRWHYPDAMDTVEFASNICKLERDKHILFLSGRDRTLEQLEDAAGHALNEGFRNIIPVSGRFRSEDTLKDLNSGRIFFTESVPALHDLSEKYREKLFLGCTVNPYQYTACASLAQTAKFMRKISCGASFAITEYGWDLKKIQELRCSLFRRGKTFPVFAGFMMLTPDLAENISMGRMPGVSISPDLQAILRKEAALSSAKFEEAQVRLLQIHAAGAKFIGCSGMILSGAERPETADFLLGKIEEALEEFSNFQEWHNACMEYYGRLNMAPYPHQFYTFEGLLDQPYIAELPEVTGTDLEGAGKQEDWKYSLLQMLFRHADELPADERLFTKKILAGCQSCSLCRLPQTFFVCPETCPKKMANGPCGNVLADGSCVYTQEECIFAKQVRFAAKENDFAALEENFVEQAPR